MKKRLHTAIYAAMLCVLIVVTGCVNNSRGPVGPGDGTPTELISLAIGNYWVLLFEEWVGDTLTYTATDSFYIDSTIVWGGNTWYRMMEKFDIYYKTMYWRNGEYGVNWLDVESEDTTDGLYLKYPALVGDSWAVPWNVPWDPRNLVIVASVDDSVTTKSENFKGCYRYNYDNSDDDEGMWFCPGFGWVKSRWRHDDKWHTFDLINFRVE